MGLRQGNALGSLLVLLIRARPLAGPPERGTGNVVGDIPSSDESNEPQAVQREDGSWLVDGLMAADDFREMFDLFESPDDEKGNYQTLGGFVIMNLGRIPAVADHFSYQGTRIEVVDMDGNRIDKVLVIPPQSPTTDS